MSIFSKVIGWIFCLIGAVSCWKLAFTLYQTWQTPLAIENGRWVSLGVGIMVMEFIMVHSGVMIPAVATSENLKSFRQIPLLLVSILYIVFGASIAVVFKSTLFLMIG